MKHLNSAATLALTASAFAGVVPEVSNVTFAQASNSRKVTITYDLGAAPAIITVDICTNGVSIGDANLRYFTGDVFKLVTNRTANGTETHTINWQPQKAWPNREITDSSVTARVYAWPVDNPPDYMVVDLIAPSLVHYYPSVDFLPGGLLGNDEYRTSKLVMRRIHASGVTWTMGSVSETGRDASKEMTHEVGLADDYYMGVFEVTQSQWARIAPLPMQMFTNVTYAAMRPVDQIAYNRVRCSDTSNGVKGGLWPNAPYEGSFLDLLRKHSGGILFDLPSEAQWEFACRAGNGEGLWNDGSSMSDSSNIGRLARYGQWYQSWNDHRNDSTNTGTTVVGSFKPNSWGLYDMHGNVYEWCLDWYSADITSFGGKVNADENDPTKPRSGTSSSRVFRGGAFNSGSAGVRSAARSSQNPEIGGYSNHGLRLMCAIPGK